MSGLTPSLIRSKTSDITDFFRTSHSSGHSRSPANDLSTQSQATTYTLDVPSTSSQDALTKKKSTRIPLFGRPRKKSNPSGTDSARESTDIGEIYGHPTSTERRLTVEMQEHARSSVLLSPSPVKSQSTSLGSKLAAHFQPRVRKLSALGQKSPAESSSSKGASLSPPDASSARGTSLDSGSSSGTRSPTPRPPTQPTITVSLTSENLDEYKDLFTMPKQKKPSSAHRDSEPPRPKTNPESSSPIPAVSTHTVSRLEDLPRRGSAPTILDGSQSRATRSQPAESPTTKSMKASRRGSPTEKPDGGTPTPRSSDGKDSARSSPSFSDKLAGPSIQRRQPIVPSTPAADYSAQQRLRMRQQAAAADKSNLPPAIPLPQPPSPSIAPSSPRASTAPNSNTTTRPQSRPRASTVGSVTSVSSSPLSQSTVPDDSQVEQRSSSATEVINIDLDGATREQLQEALRTRNRQYDELNTRHIQATEMLAVEMTALQKKVSQLEREVSNKDKQIKGLMWLVANHKSPPATDFPPNLTLPPIPGSKAESGQIPTKASIMKMPTRRMQLSDDSGAESHPTSGADSLRSSETSGNESSSRHRKLRRPFVLGEGSYNLYRAATGKRLPPKTLAPDAALPEVPQGGKRHSVSSLSPSPNSSTSSLLAPSPSMTVSSLSSIPESPTPFRYSLKPESGESGGEERRAIRAKNRMSNSSAASSSTAASSAYAVNLKRSRPPSIAQVLENSPNKGTILDKFRISGHAT
ncbi:hypothetical protein FA15DRAFT_582269 [Coprinopsis marcescibilis]|uniref:Uncharacterized protein n=1 Tax=Coprinopsis marcescibilis TaxID=230819 RepID=A0A5C3LLL0_COPMA|nr:hypothetical protein FA15DRAFT_582269 [Coprinopsis marcescibilis]